MDRLEEIRFALDEKLSETQKKFITLRTANKLLWDKRLITEFERDRGFLKSLLEQKKLNAIQTQSQPRQWKIYSSNHSSESLFLESKKPAEKKPKENRAVSKKERKKWDFGLILGIIGILALIFFGTRSHNNIEELNSPNNSSPSQIKTRETAVPQPNYKTNNKNSTSKNVFTFKSTFYDRERNGIILQTIEEETFHTFNYNDSTVTQKSKLNGEWIEIIYLFSDSYIEEGPLSNTYVFHVGTLGLKEIWYTPEVPNLGYDYDDGTRLSCYELQQVSR
ncbi:hypothetical protein FHG64_11460 [Antarcticibacterium flavum]|uniref:Uncharacterized protein n=1 Tax=Antarcticibacterium flavum TaxID=2058175 RepID=A0A5B7X5F7_9FLAO|nr:MULTISPECIES: hypothetical protein [Antarcticibacterium]MCM4159391.1 hypothetical protein [Antarcticibacterium sp. W02-3]QCY69968.1 hypothetical protein FHG64_11460 [Antarcticibacterium flavum]